VSDERDDWARWGDADGDESSFRKRDRLARLLAVASILYSRGHSDAGVPVSEIANLTGMTTRTVYRDIRALEDELGMPIFQAGKGRYGIEKKYFLPPLRLSLPEAVVLFLASRLIARWSDEYDQAVVSAFTKLADLLPQPIARHVAATMLAVGRAGPNEPFARNFAHVAQAWADGRVIEFKYEASGGERRQARVRPYFLEPDAAGRSVYLIGFDEIVDAMRTYKVERILSSTLTTDRYDVPVDFDPDRWLAHSWGIWSSDTTAPQTVRLRFEASVAQRVRESIWHRSQRIADLPDGRLELTVTVAGIVEIRPWVLSWGDAVEVLEPTALRDAVAAATRGAAARYTE
jgi:predicted DNA-binding transcriptional regulator YafY